ncbi:MAG: hypothetical protein DI555_12835 [Novosphingobium pentaromativorans]|uniref:WYL domain-containing protein n=1 Tax=Novosphingobium pentaromativorans TaxID=205844 RepID=A0A2W5NLI3_9SPHN|nr:MAG: hypothetical protein DI555_12835 [Novosphingobium pentaromativorans]
MIDTRLSLMEAISFRRTVNARYNGGIIKLAPHLMFERHGDLFVSALNLTKAWRSPEERRLGQFKLAGLEVTELLEEVFEPLPGFEAAAPREDDTLLLTV